MNTPIDGNAAASSLLADSRPSPELIGDNFPQPVASDGESEGHWLHDNETREVAAEGDGRGTSVMTLSNRGRAKFGASVTTSAISASRPPASAAETNDTDGQPDSDTAPKDDSLSGSSGEEESAAGNSGNESDRLQLSTNGNLPEDYDWRSLKMRAYGKSLPPLALSERQGLKAAIVNHGFPGKILIDERLNIIDGNHRLLICMETGRGDPGAQRG